MLSFCEEAHLRNFVLHISSLKLRLVDSFPSTVFFSKILFFTHGNDSLAQAQTRAEQTVIFALK